MSGSKTIEQIFEEQRRHSLGVVKAMRDGIDQMPRVEGITKGDVLETLSTLARRLEVGAEGELDGGPPLPPGSSA